MPSARELFAESLSLLEVLGATATVKPADEETCRRAMNTWLDAQNTHPLALYAMGRHVHDLVSGTATYTIGVGGDFDQDRPLVIDAASLIEDPSATDPVERRLGAPMTREQYQAIPQKSIDGTPRAYYYDYAFDGTGLGNVTLYPTPDSSTPDFVIYCRKHLQQIEVADLASDLILPPGYRRMLKYNLAVEVAPAFGVPVTAEVAMIARESKGDVFGANWRPSELGFPGYFSRGRRA